MSTTARFELPFKAPYDWARVLRFLAGRATPGVECVEQGAYRRAIDWQGASGTLAVARHPRRRCLVVTVDGAVARHAEALAPHLTLFFDVGADAARIGAHLARDPWLAPLVERAPGLRVPGAWSAFELVVRAIVGQQVSVKAATTLIGRLVTRAGARIEEHLDPATAWRFPTPAELAQADLSQIGMPGKRVAALQGMAHAVASGAVPIDRGAATTGDAQTLATLREALLALPGIGPWTVEYIAMRAWRDADAWPSSDLVLMQSIVARDAALVRPAAQRARTEPWRPWRAYAAMHLWNAVADQANGARGG
ncbi:AlkA N-terminal domain-containing protein [Trinickia caryophylli]|uniref:DNA-3-methyladenine glycosylase II n=1 Tax=Trinickia caryophylli TaxID=28094 RepID=A0A1X7HA79_TRICW|nr:AlkA N-terminal domain-containing protein [Trinickia caryophylli]PMS08732.1 DNA-3-methyladenine glycosylase 2 family protein [Trinickia caryophylli]TRX19012.1 DNA-3-methyladenine glycosylase 2 family protein [Trinickia caryophylli]WQE10189.1 AlkA N-terminal domain-containing protein [Trinickia caryophylli]SMF82654.1 DNA-3-methyladenine glycosylase II [Trinickia caryophylli]GLU35849.1 3-methyladenine DNA glycosylase 2 [Trinickia caryophylli]